MAVKHLILFDIDGTLLRCGPQVGPLFVDALVEVFGGYGKLEGYSFAGQTDPRIVLDLVRATGRDKAEILAKLPLMRQLYIDKLDRGLQRDGMRLLPGVVELLDKLTQHEDVMLGLLTGNWHDGARIKLDRFDLNRYFDFGAFGDDGVDRCDLVPVALERAAERNGRPFEPQHTLIIGDTVRDVNCALSAGLKSVAVTTGFTDAERLAEAGADWVFPDLVEATAHVVGFVSR